jgi:anti-sigma regulatory factor (Ser/Thr protein kinase)
MLIELRDAGPPFDPTQMRVLTGPPEDQRAPGGWGIPLIRRYIDDIAYTREDDENVLRLTKRLGDKGQV